MFVVVDVVLGGKIFYGMQDVIECVGFVVGQIGDQGCD